VVNLTRFLQTVQEIFLLKICESLQNLRRAKRGAFLMEQGRGERVKIIEWVSIVVDVAVCSYFGGIHGSSLPQGSLARSLTILWLVDVHVPSLCSAATAAISFRVFSLFRKGLITAMGT